MSGLPKISLVLLTYNSSSSVRRCLESVKRQNYPKGKIEIIVVDNGSVDESVKIAKEYTKKVYVRLVMDGGYSNRAFGMRRSSGDFIYMILEHDMELRGKNYLNKMIRPLLSDKNLIASFTREYPRKDQPWVTRFISYNPVQLDPLFEFLMPSIESTIVKKERGYFLCKFGSKKIPPTTHMLFRKSFLEKTSIWKQEKDFDHDTVVNLVRSGFNRFAYVPSAGDYHHHAKSLRELIGKRVRNLNLHYFPYQKTTGFKWFDVNSKISVIKLFFWVIYVNLFVPELLRGFIDFLRFRDWVLLMRPIVAIATTDAILFQFIKNRTGRKIIEDSLASLFNFS